jgi:hypothetical protein
MDKVQNKPYSSVKREIVEELAHYSSLKTKATSPPKRRFILNELQGVISEKVRVFHKHPCVNLRSSTDLPSSSKASITGTNTFHKTIQCAAFLPSEWPALIN